MSVQRVNAVLRAGDELPDVRRPPLGFRRFSVSSLDGIHAKHSGKGRHDENFTVHVNGRFFDVFSGRKAPENFPGRFIESVNETLGRSGINDSGGVWLRRVVRHVGKRADRFTHKLNVIALIRRVRSPNIHFAHGDEFTPGRPCHVLESIVAASRQRGNFQVTNGTNAHRLPEGSDEPERVDEFLLSRLAFLVGQHLLGDAKFLEGIFHGLQVENIDQTVDGRNVGAVLAEHQIVGRNGRNVRVQEDSAISAIQNVEGGPNREGDVIFAGSQALNEASFGFHVRDPPDFARFRLNRLNGSLVRNGENHVAVKNHSVQLLSHLAVRIGIRIRNPLTLHSVTVGDFLRNDEPLPDPLCPHGRTAHAEKSSCQQSKETKKKTGFFETIYE